MFEDLRCPQCGTSLKVITVKVPVLVQEPLPNHPEQLVERLRYQDRDDVSDCPRCTGSY